MNGRDMMLAIGKGGCYRRKSWAENTGIFLSQLDDAIYKYDSDFKGKKWPISFDDLAGDDWEIAE